MSPATPPPGPRSRRRVAPAPTRARAQSTPSRSRAGGISRGGAGPQGAGKVVLEAAQLLLGLSLSCLSGGLILGLIVVLVIYIMK